VIAQLAGTLLVKELDRVEVMTAGGVGYELLVPLTLYETLPKPGENVRLHTYLVVKEDGWQLFGFATSLERQVFQRVLGAKGVGPALALGMLSTLSVDRLVRAIRERDVATLQSVPRVGRKKAEQLILDLADKLDDVQVAAGGVGRLDGGAGAEDALRALVSLGY
jgi:Holliday junction DNA helicase RuvA